jgi:prolyl-tRNA synthetase
VKFKDCDLLGLPLRVVVGPRTLAQGAAEVRQRRSKETTLVELDKVLPYLQDCLAKEIAG